MKALEKDRARRYETANGLALDIQRHLNNEPVVACPPSRLYRLQKTVRRNKLAFAAGSAVAASLVIGLTLSTVLFFRERTARRQANEQTSRANEQAAIAKAVNDFLQEDLLRQADSRSQADARFIPDPNLTVREALARAAERIGERFKDRPLQEAAVRMAIGDAMFGLGEMERAVTHAERALELRRAKLGRDDPDTLTTMHKLATAYYEVGKRDQSLALFEETLKLRKAKLGPHHQDTLRTMKNLARTYRLAGRLDEAIPLHEETLKLQKAKLGTDDPDTLFSMRDLARAYLAAGKLDQALPLLEETLKLRKAKLTADHPDTLSSMTDLGNAYVDAGKLDEALSLYQETLKLQKARLGPDDLETLWSMNNLAVVYERTGKIAQALPLLEEAVKLGRAKLRPDHPALLQFMLNLAVGYSVSDKLDQALPLLKETLKLLQARDDPSTLKTLYETMYVLASAYRMAGKFDQALSLMEERLNLTNAKRGPNHRNTLTAMRELAGFRAERGQFAEAAADLVRVREANPENHGVWHELAPLLVASGQLDAYREHCRKSTERFGNSADPLIAERIAKDCLILPASGADLAVVAKMADTAAAVTNRSATPSFQFVKGLAEYRRGRFAGAVEWVNKALTKEGDSENRDVEAYMVLAMARYQLKQTDEARAALARGTEIERTKLPKLESGDIGESWLDWIIAHALMREAKALIEGDTKITAKSEPKRSE